MYWDYRHSVFKIDKHHVHTRSYRFSESIEEAGNGDYQSYVI